MFKEACTSLLLACVFLYFGYGTSASAYNYTTTTKCLKEPVEALYGGGIIVNPEFNHNIEGWKAFGQGKIERISKDGNRFLVAHSRKNATDSFSQKVQLEQGKIYTFSASVQVSEGSEVVAVIFKFPTGKNIRGGDVIAEHGCWTLLKGGIVANFTSLVEIHFESKNTSVEIWVDSISLQPFTKEEWKSHQDKSIIERRKSKVRLQVIQANKAPLTGAKVLIKQTKSDFPFGCGMNHNILISTEYQNWFASRFRYTTFTNEMKWYSNEKIQGQENYTIADGMVKFAKKNGISIRGHNVFWDNPKMQPSWVNSTLSPEELRTASAKRINSVVTRYKGQLIAWDVMNENLHFRFFEDKLGENASAAFYYTAQQLDPGTMMFMNEYNTMEYSSDEASSPVNYKKKLEEILSYPGNANLTAGIGLQGHFGSGQPNLAYMRYVLDYLGATGYPIWLTEVSVGIGPNQAQYLEEVLREGYSHPAVQGIIMFVGPITAGFNETPLADNSFNNTAAGDVVDKLIAEWKTGSLELTTDDQGYVEVSLFHGDYEVTAEDNFASSAATLSFKVTKDEPQSIVKVQIDT